MSSILRFSVVLLAVAFLLPFATVTEAEAQGNPPDTLYTMTIGSLNASDKLLMTTLQGLVAKTKPEIWLKRSETNMWLEELKANHGVTEVSLAGVDGFLDHFQSHINGYVLCSVGDASQNVGASLAGLWNAVAVTTTNQTRMTSRNIPMLADVRTRDDAWLNTNYGAQFNKGVLFEQALANSDLCSFLYDLATYKQGQIIYQGTTASTLRRTIAGNLNDHSPCYGWPGGHERDWVVDLSQSTSGGVAADAWHNGTVLINVPVPLPITQNTHIPGHEETENTAHYASFIISDGDNIQWYQRDFYNNSRWWASPYRGTFNVGWEMNPILAEAGPIIMKKLYDTASTGTYKDYFISGPYGYLLMSPDYYPSAKLGEYAQLLQPKLTNADLRIVNVIMYRESTLYYDRLNSVLDLPNVIGVTVKLSGSDYAKGNGAIYWRNGKPAVNYKYFMGPGRSTPTQVASGINSRPRNPKTDINSYTLVVSNAWSDNSMLDIKNCIDQLHSDIRVVSPDTFFYHMRKNFGTPFDPVPPAAPPSAPTNPNPPDLSTNVGLDATLSWTAGEGATSHKVYFGTTSPPPYHGTSPTGTTYDPGIMAPLTTYYWQVEAINAHGSTFSDPWQFTTATDDDPTPSNPAAHNWHQEFNQHSGSGGTLVCNFGSSTGGTTGSFSVIYQDGTPDSSELYRDTNNNQLVIQCGSTAKRYRFGSNLNASVSPEGGAAVGWRMEKTGTNVDRAPIQFCLTKSNGYKWTTYIVVTGSQIIPKNNSGGQLSGVDSLNYSLSGMNNYALAGREYGGWTYWKLWVNGSLAVFTGSNGGSGNTDPWGQNYSFRSAQDGTASASRIGLGELVKIASWGWRFDWMRWTDQGDVYFGDPYFHSNPADQAKNAGETATFSVAAWSGSTVAYQWQVKPQGGGWSNISGATGTSYTTPTLAESDDGNQYRCRARRGDWPFTYSQPATLTVTGGTPTPPAAPSNLAATAVSSSQINLSWTDNSNDEDGFKIERKTGAGGTWSQIDTVGANVTTYSNTELAASTTYYYRVRAYNAVGDSNYSNEAYATTQAEANPPAAPSNLAATAVSSSQINLSWTDNSNDEDGFEIWRRSRSPHWSLVDTVGANVTSYSDTGLSANTPYTYRVRAYNAAGESDWSNEASATTPK